MSRWASGRAARHRLDRAAAVREARTEAIMLPAATTARACAGPSIELYFKRSANSCAQCVKPVAASKTLLPSCTMQFGRDFFEQRIGPDSLVEALCFSLIFDLLSMSAILNAPRRSASQIAARSRVVIVRRHDDRPIEPGEHLDVVPVGE